MAMVRNGVHEVGDADMDIALDPIQQNSLVDNEVNDAIRNDADDADAGESRESNNLPSQSRPDMSATENVGMSETGITDNPSTDESNSEELFMSSTEVVPPKDAKRPSGIQRQNVETSVSNNESDETSERNRMNSAVPARSPSGTTSPRDTIGQTASTSSRTEKPHNNPSDSIASSPLSTHSVLSLYQVKPPNHQNQHISNNRVQGNWCSYTATPQRFSGPQNNPPRPSPVRRLPNSPLGHEYAVHQSQSRTNGQTDTRTSHASLQTYDPPTTFNHISAQAFQEHSNQAVTHSQVVELMTSRDVSTRNANNSTSSVGATNAVALHNQERAGYSAPSALSELYMREAEPGTVDFEQFGNRDEPEGQNYSLQGEALALLCLVCQRCRVRIVFVPCHHLVCCMPCSAEQSRCPVPTCREIIDDMGKVSIRSMVENRNSV